MLDVYVNVKKDTSTRHGAQPITKQYTIRDLADEFAVTTRTIRFYEDLGMLTPRREGTRRVFSGRDRTRLKLILRGKRIGFSLAG